jgi:uncharacterized damage-inducible protein DinB
MNSYFQEAFEYDNWAKKKLAGVIIGLGEAPERANELYAHLLASNHIWQCRLLNLEPQMQVWEPIPPINWLAQQERNHAQLQEFLKNSPTERFAETLHYKTTKGVPFQNTVQGILTHMLTHANYHMGQINLVLKPVLSPLPDLMYISYEREPRL